MAVDLEIAGRITALEFLPGSNMLIATCHGGVTQALRRRLIKARPCLCFRTLRRLHLHSALSFRATALRQQRTLSLTFNCRAS